MLAGAARVREERCGYRVVAKQDYPSISRQVSRDKAATYWGEEMGMRSDHVTGTSSAMVGQPTVSGHRPAPNGDMLASSTWGERPQNDCATGALLHRVPLARIGV